GTSARTGNAKPRRSAGGVVDEGLVTDRLTDGKPYPHWRSALAVVGLRAISLSWSLFRPGFIFQGKGRRQQPLILPTRQPFTKLPDWKTNRLLVITYPN